MRVGQYIHAYTYDEDSPNRNSWTVGKSSGLRGDLCLVRTIASQLGVDLTTADTTLASMFVLKSYPILSLTSRTAK